MSVQSDHLQLTSRPLRAGTELRVTGEVDLASAGELVLRGQEALHEGGLVLDLEAVSFMDSSGVRALEALMRTAEETGAPLAIRPQLARSVREVLELTGLLHVLPFEASG
jgi:anti-anti-sigma factor